MSVEAVEEAIALLSEERPVGWVQYPEGGWAPVTEDGRIGETFTAADLTEIAHRDLLELEEAGLICVIDVEPLEITDTERRCHRELTASPSDTQ
ncbi:hypothetical protein D7D52_28790 [Nocardia yunnanensis]|uniref:Uncharacterized protein n=1 Tax=Nocardia yunnanensis TaxID=2382165 RepID=A0A386ZI04_9NOCA|nr:hypothetical protein [Nocardia yunnanensis]AYF77151.1 hypothetical protein D7D52_28790 [Nocardia yunnanensis]